MGRLQYEARDPIATDITTIEALLALPPNAKSQDLVNRARTFDLPLPRRLAPQPTSDTVGPRVPRWVIVGEAKERRSNI